MNRFAKVREQNLRCFAVQSQFGLVNRRRTSLFPLALLLWLPLALWSQPETNPSDWPAGQAGADFNFTDADGLKQGRWIRVYPDGTLYYSGSFKDGRPVGHFTFFRETGRVLSEVDHAEGSDIAKALLYREDGTVSHRGQYTTVQLDGEWKQLKTGAWEALDKQGRLRVNEHYVGDTLDGSYQAFHPNGQLLEEGTYRAGKKAGTWKSYNREGQLRSEEMWREGERHGEATVMQDQGALLSKGNYENGLPVGVWTLFNPNGKPRSLITYQGGRVVKEEPQNGEFEATYPSGRPEWVARFAFGRMDGPFTAWYDLGEWVMAPADQEAGRAGAPPMSGGGRPGVDPMRRELRNQPMKEMGEYTAGVKDGTWRYFDESGGVIRTERWTLGKLTGTEE